MIAKGTTHDNGGKLGRYLVTGKKGELAELYELRGFASDNIVDAFRSVHVVAAATKAEQPFFHVQVRNPEGETLTLEQWVYTADRIERMLGLKDQPRAIAFHADGQTGERHMHVAWSRIDEETLTAKALPFYKDRLKKISRELEMHFGLTLVPNERADEIKYAPTRAEDEQARRLGLDPHAVRQTIRQCWERADCGRRFEAALVEQGMVLAAGDRRDYLVIDAAGGMHALGKRLLGVSAADVRKHLADLLCEQLPSVEEAREFLREQRARQERKKPAPAWDRERHEVDWQKAVVDAAVQLPRPALFAERGEDSDDERHRQLNAALMPERVNGGPQTGHMVEHHEWALKHARIREERLLRETTFHTTGATQRQGSRNGQVEGIDLARFKTDPDYRRSIEEGAAQDIEGQKRQPREQASEVAREFGQR